MKAIDRTITRTLRVLLVAALLLGLALIPSPGAVWAAVSFADQGALGLPAVRYGSVAWGDYDNDGRLDVLVAGCTDGTCTARTARVYHNNGSGNFTDANAGLPGVAYSAAAWGDYDGDGRLDILLAGNTGSARIAKVYHNNGDGTFADSGASLAGVDYAAATWGDQGGWRG